MRMEIAALVLAAAACSSASRVTSPPSVLENDPLPPHAAVRLGTVRFRHSVAVSGAWYSADGTRLYTRGGDHRIRVWNAGDGRPLGVVEPPVEPSYIVFAARDRAGRLRVGWLHGEHRLQEGQQIVMHRLFSCVVGDGAGPPTVLEDVGREVHGVAMSPDGRMLAVHGRESVISIWDLEKRIKVRELSGHDGPISAMAFSGDGFRLATSGRDCSLRIWGVADGSELSNWDVRVPPVGLTFLPGDGAVAGVNGDRLRVWETGTGAPRFDHKQAHGEGVSTPVFSPDGLLMATGGGDRFLRLWNVATGEKVREMTPGGGGRLAAAAFSPDGRMLVSTSADTSVRRWDISTGREIRASGGHGLPVKAVAVSPDGSRIATGSWDFTVRLWDAATGREVHTLPGHSYGAFAVAFSPDGRLLASAGGDQRVRLWDPDAGREVRALDRGEVWLSSVAFSPDGRTLAYASGLPVRLWDVAEVRVRATLDATRVAGTGPFAYSPDGRFLAMGSGGDDNAVYAWNLEAGGRARRMGSHPRNVCAIGFSPDSGRLFTADEGGGAAAWDFPAGVEAWSVGAGRMIDGFDHTGLAVHPSGRYVAVSGGGDRVVVLGAERGDLLFEIRTGAGGTNALAWTPDGRRLVSGHQDSTALVWDLWPDRPAAAGALRGATGAALDAWWKRLGERVALLDDLRTLADPSSPLAGSFVETVRREELLDEDVLRSLRVVLVLDWMGTPEAVGMLEWLALGRPSPLQRDAQALARRRWINPGAGRLK